MKTKLLRKIRNRASDEVHIHSITREGDTIIGMSYGYNDDCYRNIFDIGDTEELVMRKVQHIYFDRVKSYWYKKIRR